MLRMMRAADTDPLLRSAVVNIIRGMEILARTQSRLATLSSDSIDELRRIVLDRRGLRGGCRSTAAGRSDDGTDRGSRRGRRDTPSRCPHRRGEAAGGRRPRRGRRAGRCDRAMELLTDLLRDNSITVRIEAVRAWARQENRENGCQRLLETLQDPVVPVVLAALDALGDTCKDDVNVTDRLTSEAKAPESAEWHRASHALVALAKRSPSRAFIALRGGHVRHEIWQVRMYAARAAAIANDVTSLERLSSDEEDNVREATLAPLRRLKGDEAEPYFAAALGRSDYQLLRTAAIELKAAKPTPQLATALLDALRRVTAEKKETSRDTRLALLERLQELGTPDQTGALVPLLRDFDIRVAQLAAVVIQQWTGKLLEIDPQLLPRPALPAGIGSSIEPARVKMKSGKVFFINLRAELAPLDRCQVRTSCPRRLLQRVDVPSRRPELRDPGRQSRGERVFGRYALHARRNQQLVPRARSCRHLDARPGHRRRSVLHQLGRTIRASTSNTRSLAFVQNPNDIDDILEGDAISTSHSRRRTSRIGRIRRYWPRSRCDEPVDALATLTRTLPADAVYAEGARRTARRQPQ